MIWDLSCSNFHSYRRSMCTDHLHNVNPSCNAVWLTSNSTTNPNSQYTFRLGVNAGTKIATVRQDLKLSIFFCLSLHIQPRVLFHDTVIIVSLSLLFVRDKKNRICRRKIQFSIHVTINHSSVWLNSRRQQYHTINMHSLIGVFTVSQMNYFWQTMCLFSVNLKSLYHNSNSIYEYIKLPRCIKHAKNKCTYR